MNKIQKLLYQTICHFYSIKRMYGRTLHTIHIRYRLFIYLYVNFSHMKINLAMPPMSIFLGKGRFKNLITFKMNLLA